MLNIFTVHYISLVLSIIAVFTYVPVISDFAFWFALVAYLMLWGHRPPAK